MERIILLTKLLLMSWTWGEKYFATKLVDYDQIQNSGGWQWTACGIDPQQVLRIFSPKSQSVKFDPECKFIKKWIPELEKVPNKDIHDWENKYVNYDKIYLVPAIDYMKSRKNAIKAFKIN